MKFYHVTVENSIHLLEYLHLYLHVIHNTLYEYLFLALMFKQLQKCSYETKSMLYADNRNFLSHKCTNWNWPLLSMGKKNFNSAKLTYQAIYGTRHHMVLPFFLLTLTINHQHKFIYVELPNMLLSSFSFEYRDFL